MRRCNRDKKKMSRGRNKKIKKTTIELKKRKKKKNHGVSACPIKTHRYSLLADRLFGSLDRSDYYFGRFFIH